MAYITNSDVYRVCGITSSVISTGDVDSFIGEAESYVENMLGTKFFVSPDTYADEVTETYDGNDLDYLFLDHFPVVSVESLTINGTSVTTTALYLWESTGKIQLKDTAEKTYFDANKPQLVSITYRYGEEASNRVIHFTAMLAGMMALIHQIGGTFDDVTSFQLPEMSGSLGEPYTNIREGLNQLKVLEQNLRQFVRVKPQFG